MHDDPTRTWTVDELAREVALSRSALADRFAALVGDPPMQYLMRWRLALAARTLRSGGDAIVRVAERSGYVSELRSAAHSSASSACHPPRGAKLARDKTINNSELG